MKVMRSASTPEGRQPARSPVTDETRFSRSSLEPRIGLGLFYYSVLKPHQGLGGATPAEIYFQKAPARLSAVPPPKEIDPIPPPTFVIRHLDAARRLPRPVPEGRVGRAPREPRGARSRHQAESNPTSVIGRRRRKCLRLSRRPAIRVRRRVRPDALRAVPLAIGLLQRVGPLEAQGDPAARRPTSCKGRIRSALERAPSSSPRARAFGGRPPRRRERRRRSRASPVARAPDATSRSRA